MRVYNIAMATYFVLLLCGYLYFAVNETEWSFKYWFNLVFIEICIVMIALNLSRVFNAKG